MDRSLDLLLEEQLKKLSLKSMTRYLRQLSELELVFLRELTNLEIGFRESEAGTISLNRDDEKRSLV